MWIFSVHVFEIDKPPLQARAYLLPQPVTATFSKSKHAGGKLQVHLSPGERNEMMEVFLAGGLSLVGGWAGAYIGSYLKKKGENKAIHENLGKLLDQVAAVTRTTKEIETKISDEVWDRQKRWELKREVLFEATRALAGIEDALISLHSLTQVEKKENDITWATARHDKVLKWTKAYSVFEESSLLVAAVCSKEAGQAFLSYGGFVVRIALPIANDNDSEIYKKTRGEHNKQHLELQNIIRKELGVDPVIA